MKYLILILLLSSCAGKVKPIAIASRDSVVSLTTSGSSGLITYIDSDYFIGVMRPEYKQKKRKHKNHRTTGDSLFVSRGYPWEGLKRDTTIKCEEGLTLFGNIPGTSIEQTVGEVGVGRQDGSLTATCCETIGALKISVNTDTITHYDSSGPIYKTVWRCDTIKITKPK